MSGDHRRRDGRVDRRRYLQNALGTMVLFAGCSERGRGPTRTSRTAESERTGTATGDVSTTGGQSSPTATERPAAITSVDPPVVDPPEQFVETHGTALVLDGESYRIRATSNSRLLQPWTRRALIDELVEEAAAMGMNALRIWAFRNGVPADLEDDEQCLQPRPGVYGEKAFARFDYLIAKAKRHGVRLIPALVNNWDPYGSMKQYVRWSTTAPAYDEAPNGRGEVHDAFYTDEGARRLYREYVEYVLTRENSITGLEYREDPTILLWELANEPRAHTVGPDPLQAWIESMAAFVKSIDSNHLLSTGSEGFYSGGEGHWMYTGATGVDYLRNHRPDAIDVTSFHCWPDHWDITVARSREWIERHVREAHEELGKPAFLGEYGWPVDRTGSKSQRQRALEERNEVFETWHATLEASDCNGAAAWQHRGHTYGVGDETPPLTGFDGDHADPYAFYHPEDAETVHLLERYAKASA